MKKMRKGIRHTENKQQMAEVSPSLSLVILNINGLNCPTKAETGRMDF